MKAAAARERHLRMQREAAKVQQEHDPLVPILPPILPAGVPTERGTGTGPGGRAYGVMANGMLGFLPQPGQGATPGSSQATSGGGAGPSQAAIATGTGTGTSGGHSEMSLGLSVAPDGSSIPVRVPPGGPGLATGGGVVMGGLVAPQAGVPSAPTREAGPSSGGSGSGGGEEVDEEEDDDDADSNLGIPPGWTVGSGFQDDVEMNVDR